MDRTDPAAAGRMARALPSLPSLPTVAGAKSRWCAVSLLSSTEDNEGSNDDSDLT